MRQRSLRSATGALGLGFAIIATLLVAPTAGTSPAVAATATNNPDFTANVMAPLEVSDWNQFSNQLSAVKSYGVDAVTVDVWWGKVEAAGDNQFNWSYYDQVFQTITSRGLDIVPIFSFHQCGGNVGDTCNIPLPSWLWGKYTGATLNGITLDANGLKHRSEQGNVSNETVQGWATPLVQNEYQAFTQAFVARYGTTYANRMQEINVSLGPAGELRYPSYNSHDSGTGYPTRGALQSASLEITLPGSTVQYYKFTYQFAQYLRMTDALTFYGHFSLGYGDTYKDPKSVMDPTDPRYMADLGGLPFFENFYAGGVADVRGFRDNTLGPYYAYSPITCPTTDKNCRWPLGGALKTTASAEVIFPTPFMKESNDSTRLSAFLDVGNVFNNKLCKYSNLDCLQMRTFSADQLRASVGLSFQWRAPVGPIVINLSKPIRKKPGDDTETIQFTFGNTF